MEPNGDGTTTWTSNEAKLRFSALLDRVTWAGPQRITRSGTEVAILVRSEDWRQPPAFAHAGWLTLAEAIGLDREALAALFRRDESLAVPPLLDPEAAPDPLGLPDLLDLPPADEARPQDGGEA